MNNATAIVLAVILVSLGLADWLFNDGAIWISAGRRLIQLTEYIAFWR